MTPFLREPHVPCVLNSKESTTDSINQFHPPRRMGLMQDMMQRRGLFPLGQTHFTIDLIVPIPKASNFTRANILRYILFCNISACLASIIQFHQTLFSVLGKNHLLVSSLSVIISFLGSSSKLYGSNYMINFHQVLAYITHKARRMNVCISKARATIACRKRQFLEGMAAFSAFNPHNRLVYVNLS